MKTNCASYLLCCCSQIDRPRLNLWDCLAWFYRQVIVELFYISFFKPNLKNHIRDWLNHKKWVVKLFLSFLLRRFVGLGHCIVLLEQQENWIVIKLFWPVLHFFFCIRPGCLRLKRLFKNNIKRCHLMYKIFGSPGDRRCIYKDIKFVSNWIIWPFSINNVSVVTQRIISHRYMVQ